MSEKRSFTIKSQKDYPEQMGKFSIDTLIEYKDENGIVYNIYLWEEGVSVKLAPELMEDGEYNLVLKPSGSSAFNNWQVDVSAVKVED